MGRKFNIKNLDWFLIALVLLLTFSGLIVIYSATTGPESTTFSTFYKQVVFFFIGLTAAAIMYSMPSRLLFAFAYVLYAFALMLLVVVLLIGTGRDSASWIRIGGIIFQPSEFAKIAVVIAVARYLSQIQVQKKSVLDLIVVFLLIAVPVYLIKEQPDLGTSLVFLFLIIPMLYWAGIQPFILFVLMSPFVSLAVCWNFYLFLGWMLAALIILYASKKTFIVVIGLLAFNIAVGATGPVLWNQLKDYQKDRILSLFDPEKDPQGSSYQVLQSLYAIGSGGIEGKGFKQGSQTQLRFLPEQHNDFIFSVVGEEFGFIGVSFVLLLFLLLITRLIVIAANQKSRFNGLIVIGFASIILFHVIVNTGMTVMILPVTGLPLPFLSSGGSFLVSLMAMSGIVVRISQK